MDRSFGNDLEAIENELRTDPIGNMGNIEVGQKILNDPQARNTILSELHNRVIGYNSMSEEMKKKLDDGTLQAMQQHPGAVGKMFENMKVLKGYKQDSLNSDNPT